MIRAQLVLLTLFIQLACFPPWAVSSLLRVPSDYSSIQASLDAFSEGDTILVAAGTYYEHLSAPQNVVMISEEGPDATVIDGQETGRVLTANNVTLRGFTIQNGRINDDGGGILGSGILSNCIFADNQAGGLTSAKSGGALNGSFVGTQCTFRNNFASNKGGAIAGSFSGTDCLFEFNTADVGSGGAVLGVGTIERSVFRGNMAKYGAAIRCGGGELIECEFYDHGTLNNVVHQVGGTLTVDHCVFANNQAPAGSVAMRTISVEGPINSLLTRANVTNSTFFGNQNLFEALTSNGTGPVEIDIQNTIVATSSGVIQFCQENGAINWHCSDVWDGEVPNDVCGEIVDLIVEDPLLCAPLAEDFTLNSGSPCLPEHSGSCGQIGARAQGCGPVGVRRSSWGGLKSRH